MEWDPLFEDYFPVEKTNEKSNEVLDEEDRKKEEETGNHPLSLQGNDQTSQAAAQESSSKERESSTQERGTVPEVQSNVAPPVERSKPVEISDEQKEVQEATKLKPGSSSSQRSSLSQSQWADEPTDLAPKDKRSGPVKDLGAQKKADETVKQQHKPTNIGQSAPKQPKQTDNKPQGNTTGIPVKDSGAPKKAEETISNRTKQQILVNILQKMQIRCHKIKRQANQLRLLESKRKKINHIGKKLYLLCVPCHQTSIIQV
jgi:hypothetical protein